MQRSALVRGQINYGGVGGVSSCSQSISTAAQPGHRQSTAGLCCSARKCYKGSNPNRYIAEEYYSKYFNAFLGSTVQDTPPGIGILQKTMGTERWIWREAKEFAILSFKKKKRNVRDISDTKLWLVLPSCKEEGCQVSSVCALIGHVVPRERH